MPNVKSVTVGYAFRNCNSKIIENASLLGELPCFVYGSIQSLNDFNTLPNTVEVIIIGNNCLNELDVISFDRFENAIVIDVGKKSLKTVNRIGLKSMVIV